ncbi:hypothetical protein [Acidovorax sp. K2F]|uniref:hypothetical protein n=1 Tax=Acidovorax sp. K2F TaxID=2978125 RepID=UPI0021B1564F|nr:hypothetical protein [Acidovorax sp. K2F]MCT6719414.1 hypothetical protein [Acidovorax sp. K2F]
MIAGALAAIAAISIIGYVVAISLGRQPTKDLLTVAMVALIASCTTAAPDRPKGSLVNVEVSR